MIIKNTLINSTAFFASCAVPVGAFSLALATAPVFGVFGAAAFTTVLSGMGWIVGLPTLVGGLLGLLLLQVLTYLIAFILLHLLLAWMPV
ncbi:hypothetical protein H6F67_05170 [Microcoleus sp. FACHB-1515]|uniref:hypothetical protein n=1 Tax=Cyanophyceae TaxID=3028117 RepID=UPI00168433F3|nr:hypothetical protein [Microcoleus sp. FACHB-1515]MBD2089240.1 hypothetical protein [Microcoleus sp. FACHB-1515]